MQNVKPIIARMTKLGQPQTWTPAHLIRCSLHMTLDGSWCLDSVTSYNCFGASRCVVPRAWDSTSWCTNETVKPMFSALFPLCCLPTFPRQWPSTSLLPLSQDDLVYHIWSSVVLPCHVPYAIKREVPNSLFSLRQDGMDNAATSSISHCTCSISRSTGPGSLDTAVTWPRLSIANNSCVLSKAT